MSGPKVSVYELSAEQRQNLRVQLSCLQQSLVCCEEIKKSVGYLNGLNGQIQSLLATFTIVNQRTKNCSGEIAILHDLQGQLPNECTYFKEQLLSISPKLQVDRLVLTDAELDRKKNLLVKLRSLQNTVVARQKAVEVALKPMDAKAEHGVHAVEDAIAVDISSVKSFLIPIAESDEEKFAAKKKALEEKLTALALSEDCPSDLKREVTAVTSALLRVSNEEQLGIFQSITLQSLFIKVESASKQKLEQKSEYENLQSRYTALCSVAGIQPDAYLSNKCAIVDLREKIALLEKQVVMQTEQEFISDCVNEVMSDMGYDVIGSRSVTKRSGKRFKNELFSYGEGTAINVTYDSDGQIAMELGGIGTTDRIPTMEETDALCGDMEAFCYDFKDMEERLKARGVVIKSRVSMAPPTAEYAMIINVSDYEITAANAVREIAVKETRAKTTAKRTLQREDN